MEKLSHVIVLPFWLLFLVDKREKITRPKSDLEFLRLGSNIREGRLACHLLHTLAP